MPIAHLADRALVRVAGPDAEHFLQNIVTADLDQLGEGKARPSALLTPQGKILFDFLVSRDGPGAFVLDVRADVADDFMRRLMLYRLRAKVEIAKRDQAIVAVSWDAESATGLRDMRFAELDVRRAQVAQPPAESDMDAWTRLRIAHGVAESGADYELGDAFPHDVLLDRNGGVGFRKGCYVGQEVVSRMQHRGTARRRVLIVRADRDLPAPGTPLTVAGRPVGTLGSVAGRDGLAIARIDKVADATRAGQDVEADGVVVTLSIPAWAGFDFPAAAETEAD